jgi:hypothetical protein
MPAAPLGGVVVSDVPALLMEGAFDTNKDPGFADVVAANFTTAYPVIFGDKAHVVLGECALEMMAGFMDDPYTRPDTSCVADRPDFAGPAGPVWWIVYSNLMLIIAGAVILLVGGIAAIVVLIRRRRARRLAEAAS